jgi:hypothetical protein
MQTSSSSSGNVNTSIHQQASSSSSNLATNWTVSLSDKQNELIVNLKTLVSERPLPFQLQKGVEQENFTSTATDKLDEHTLSLPAVVEEIENMQQFYSWFEELGEDSVTEEKYRYSLLPNNSCTQCFS